MATPAGRNVVIGLGIAAVISAIVWGLMILGPPGDERARRMDDRRVADLAAIGRRADLYRSRHGKLPVGLDEMERDEGPGVSTGDPVTQQPYEYRVLDSRKLELCAQFQRDSSRGEFGPGDFWYHGAGRRCFVWEVSEVQR